MVKDKKNIIDEKIEHVIESNDVKTRKVVEDIKDIHQSVSQIKD